MRAFVEGLCRLMLRIFFSRVDVVGVKQVPADGPLLIVANHPNGLMDPLVMLTQSPRPVSFMSKEPLFRTPVASMFVKALDCLPIYRKKDGADTTANRRTMEAARAILGRGGAIGIFPEGISHDEPRLQPLKTGAARMALATQRLIADAGGGTPLRIQPVGLFFEDKATFRSEAVIVWGPPIEVPLVEIDAAAEPGRDDTHALNETIAARMRALAPDAPDAGRVAMAARIARLLAAVEVQEGEHSETPGMGHRLALMQRLLSGYARAETAEPGRLRRVLARIEQYERDLSYWRLPPELSAQLPGRGVVRSLLATLVRMTLLAPLAGVGLLLNYPAYRLLGWASRRFTGGQNDVVSTVKTLGGLVLFPLSWTLAALLVALSAGALDALVLLLGAAPASWAALHFADHLDALGSARRSLGLWLARGDRHASLQQAQREIRDELVAIEAALDPAPAAA